MGSHCKSFTCTTATVSPLPELQAESHHPWIKKRNADDLPVREGIHIKLP